MSRGSLPESPDASLVVAIPSYNGRHLLEIILPSLVVQTFRDFRVVVVDDASGDDTVGWLALEWPEVEVIALPRNGGVTHAFNVCVGAAGDAPMLGLFNNDLELHGECLAELVGALEKHPEAASAGAKLLSFYDRGIIDGAGDIFDWAGTATRRGHGDRDVGQYDTPQALFGACAGAAVYRRSAFDRVGTFDERFFAFFEDVDWNFRAQLAGLECRYVPTAIAFHMGSATLGPGMTDFTRYQLTRNSIWILAKDFPVGWLVMHAPRIFYVQFASFVEAAVSRQLRVWLRAMRDALKALPAVTQDRRQVQATRAVAHSDLRRIVEIR